MKKQETELKELFQKMRRDERAEAPSFGEVLVRDREESRARRRRASSGGRFFGRRFSSRRFSGVFAAALALALALAVALGISAFLIVPPWGTVGEEDKGPGQVEISAVAQLQKLGIGWQAPSDFLLEIPGHEFLRPPDPPKGFELDLGLGLGLDAGFDIGIGRDLYAMDGWLKSEGSDGGGGS